MTHQAADPPYALVVDDDPAARETVGEALYRRGFVPFLVSSGQDALDLMRGSSAPVLIVLDLGVRGMRPRELLAQFSSDARWAHARVLLISKAPDIDAPRDVRFDGLLRTPVDVESLLRLASGQGPLGAR